MYGTFSIVGFMFIYFYVPETMYLSKNEKFEIFWPGGIAGRKLRPEETCDVGYEHRSDFTIKKEVERMASVNHVPMFGGGGAGDNMEFGDEAGRSKSINGTPKGANQLGGGMKYLSIEETGENLSSVLESPRRSRSVSALNSSTRSIDQ